MVAIYTPQAVSQPLGEEVLDHLLGMQLVRVATEQTRFEGVVGSRSVAYARVFDLSEGTDLGQRKIAWQVPVQALAAMAPGSWLVARPMLTEPKGAGQFEYVALTEPAQAELADAISFIEAL